MAALRRSDPEFDENSGDGRVQVSELSFEIVTKIFLEKTAELETRLAALEAFKTEAEAKIAKLESRRLSDRSTDVSINDDADVVDGLLPTKTQLNLSSINGKSLNFTRL